MHFFFNKKGILHEMRENNNVEMSKLVRTGYSGFRYYHIFFVRFDLTACAATPGPETVWCANTNWISPLQKQLLQYILYVTMYYFFFVRSKLGSLRSIVMHSMRSLAVLWFDTMKVYMELWQKQKRKDERASERNKKVNFFGLTVDTDTTAKCEFTD